MCYNFSIEHFTIMKQRVRETLSVTMNINRHGVKIFKSKVSFYMQSIRFFLVFFFLVCTEIVYGISVATCA